jgi:hypothetical protein
MHTLTSPPYRYLQITEAQYQEFQKDYVFQILKYGSDYRLGQHFLNYFTDINNALLSDGDISAQHNAHLYNCSDPAEAEHMIRHWFMS